VVLILTGSATKEAELTGLLRWLELQADGACGLGGEFNVEPPIALGNRHAYAAFIDQLIEQVERVNNPAVGVAFDFGHCYTASTHFGYDYMHAVRQVMPHVNHLHIYDSFGKPNKYPALSYQDLYNYGIDDLHLPIGWGNIPFKQIFSTLDIPSVIFMLELKPRFILDAGDCLSALRALAALDRTN
jgi:sugar phosphate isomerase/epimerase